MNNIVDPTTKQFLARVVAWPQEGDAVAYMNVHYTFVPSDVSTLRRDKNGNPIYPFHGYAYQSADAAAKSVARLSSQSGNRDLYFCTSTQRLAEEKLNAKGYKYLKAIRQAENAVRMKAIFLDSDLKNYGSIPQWKAAFAQFLKDTSLPMPSAMVFSGGGFHIYWTLMEALTVDKWMPLAYALAEATKRHGFQCDTQCTIDAARILRIPGTLNHKYDPPTKVTLLGNIKDFDYANAKLEAILEPYKVQVPYSMASVNMSLFPPRQELAGVSDLSAGVDVTIYDPVDLDTILPSCGFLNDAVTTGGKDLTNPLWNLTTLISTFTQGGRADAHRMASGHVNYGPGETDDLYDRKLDEKLKKNMGWPRCATISGHGATACSTCPLMAHNKSPLNFAVRTHTAAPQHAGGFSAATVATLPATASATILGPSTSTAAADLPSGFLRDSKGLILRPETDDTGSTTWTAISTYPMDKPYFTRDPLTLNFTSEVEYNKTTTISISTEFIGQAEMKKELQKQGFMIAGQRAFNLLVEFMNAWIKKLQSMPDSYVNRATFGWVTSKGKTSGFVYGGLCHTPSGTEVATPSDPELARQYAPHGDRLPWIHAAHMITDQKRPQLDAIIASAFAAPLVRFTGHAGLLMSAFSVESGIGKSTALKIAQAVWGDPVRAVQSLSDTQNSVLHKMGEIRSLPMYWDELKSAEDSKRFVDTVFRLTLGKEKSRMTSRVTQRQVGSWETMLVSASNESLLDVISDKTKTTTAGIYRIFEYTVQPAAKGSAGQIDHTVAQRMLSKLHDNYGVIGMEYASYLGSNLAQIEIDMAKTLAKVRDSANMSTDERFWGALIASIIQGAIYANKLGFTKIDVAALTSFMIATLKDMRKMKLSAPVDMRDPANIVNALGRFINETRARHTITTNIIHRAKGKPVAGAVKVVSDASRLEAIHVHVGIDDHIIRIGRSYFENWLIKNNYSRQIIVRGVEEILSGKYINARLGTGTIYANPSEHLLEIDLKQNNLMNFIDEA